MIDSLLEWARILLITAFAGTLATLLLPEGGLNGYVKLAAAAVTAAVVVAPIAGLFGSLRIPSPPAAAAAGKTPVTAVSAREIVAGETVRSLEEEVKNIIYERSGINCQSVNIYIQKDRLDEDGKIVLEKAEIYSGGGGDAIKAAGLPEYLRGALGCEVEFIDGGGNGPGA